MKRIGASLVMDGRGRQSWFDELDSSSIDDLVVRRSGNDHGPAEVVGDAEAHAAILPQAFLRRRHVPSSPADQCLPWMIMGKEASKSLLSLRGQCGDYLAGVLIVLRPMVLALEDQLKLGSEVGDPVVCHQHGISPGRPQ